MPSKTNNKTMIYKKSHNVVDTKKIDPDKDNCHKCSVCCQSFKPLTEDVDKLVLWICNS